MTRDRDSEEKTWILPNDKSAEIFSHSIFQNARALYKNLCPAFDTPAKHANDNYTGSFGFSVYGFDKTEIPSLSEMKDRFDVWHTIIGKGEAFQNQEDDFALSEEEELYFETALINFKPICFMNDEEIKQELKRLRLYINKLLREDS